MGKRRSTRRCIGQAVLLAALHAQGLNGFGQTGCPGALSITGVVTDPSGALVADASITSQSGRQVKTDSRGRYILNCVDTKDSFLSVHAPGFTDTTLRIPKRAGASVQLSVRLAIEQVQSEVTVSPTETGLSAQRGAGTISLNQDEISRLPDDPDDLVQQLQILTAGSGGDPSTARIYVDGFQNASALPPKSSIASIRVNPDIFAPEYLTPAWTGGRIEITTKTGADKVHGALFLTDSDGSFNARNPFSVSSTPAGKRRYGFELSGPIVPAKSGFSAALEKRDIDEYSVVNARTLDANDGLGGSGNGVPLQETVATPQRLWIASARGDLQISPKDIATASFSANVNSLGNQGIGGLVASTAGYDSFTSEYDLRLSNTFTASANVLNQTRIGYTWKRNEQTPRSMAPSLQVVGYFTSGGATSQASNSRERDLEIDNETTANHHNHELKVGIQALAAFVHDYLPDTFNGAYTFGGGSAPILDVNNLPTGNTENITPLEQYRRALLHLAGGTATTYQINSGNPVVPFTQWRLGFYGQDNIKVGSKLTVLVGMRYQVVTNPSSYNGFQPRMGISWAPDKKQSWVFRLRAGLFTAPYDLTALTAVSRLDGTRQQQQTTYAADYSNPGNLTPNSILVATVNRFAHGYGQDQNIQLSAVVEHDLPHQWHLTASYNFGGNWVATQAVNVNAPLVSNNIGATPDPIAALKAPRPIAGNENVIQYQRSGHSRGDFYLASIDQHSYKRWGFHAQYWYLHFRENPLTPQSAYTSTGESARPDWMRRGGFAFVGNGTLPFKLELATQFTAMPGRPFNITTGTDSNGDGNFNDRPSYAPVGYTGATYVTRYGRLTTDTVNGTVPYNAGTMPGVMYLSANLSRAFELNPKDRDHLRTLTFNVRSANLLNHTNVNAVNTVLSSSLVGNPVSAETARRVELGARFTF